MYKGNNQIALRSQEWLYKALFILLKQKPFEKITITDICNKAGVSRQTFYQLFDNKEEIIKFYLEVCLCVPDDYYIYCKDERSKLLEFYFTTLESEKDNIFLLFENKLECFLFERLKNQILDIQQHDEKKAVNTIYSDFFCYALVGLTRSWVMQYQHLSVREIISIGSDLLETEHL